MVTIQDFVPLFFEIAVLLELCDYIREKEKIVFDINPIHASSVRESTIAMKIHLTFLYKSLIKTQPPSLKLDKRTALQFHPANFRGYVEDLQKKLDKETLNAMQKEALIDFIQAYHCLHDYFLDM